MVEQEGVKREKPAHTFYKADEIIFVHNGNEIIITGKKINSVMKVAQKYIIKNKLQGKLVEFDEDTTFERFTKDSPTSATYAIAFTGKKKVQEFTGYAIISKKTQKFLRWEL